MRLQAPPRRSVESKPMSTNCVKCVVNSRTGFDLLCDKCRLEDKAEHDRRSLLSPSPGSETARGKALPRPSEAGWWWWTNKGNDWTIVRVLTCPAGLYCLDLNMADKKAAGCLPFRGWLGSWVGPLASPALSPNWQVGGCMDLARSSAKMRCDVM